MNGTSGVLPAPSDRTGISTVEQVSAVSPTPCVQSQGHSGRQGKQALPAWRWDAACGLPVQCSSQQAAAASGASTALQGILHLWFE